MKNWIVLMCVAGAMVVAQPRVNNWGGLGGDPQHSGYERVDSRFTPETAKNIQLLWKMKLQKPPVTAPVILGNLISYRGFKELAFVATNSDVLYAIDADLGKLFWTKHLEYASLEPKLEGSGVCAGGLTATPVMPVPAPRGAPAARGPAPAAARGPAPAPGPPPVRGPFYAVGTGSLYAISSDGRLHRINTSTGDDFTQPMQVIPSNANISSLNLNDNTLYGVTSHGCDGSRDAVWAVDLTAETLKPVSFPLTDAGAGSPVIATDGTVYVQTSKEVLVLNGKDLALKHSFTLASNEGAAPLVFREGDRDLIAVAGKDGKLRLLDSGSLEPVSESGANVTGGFASWQEMDAPRWVAAATRNGIAAFKVEDRGGKPALTPGWTSPQIASPQGPVMAGGVVFALAGGPRAVLHALDAATGKELYSSGSMIQGAASGTGMTVANGRVYFSTADGTVYCFGIYLEH